MKKLTRKEKKKLIAQGVCWKCGKTTIKQNNDSIQCTNCKLKIIKY
jgi:predicted Zn-ribbon and HTH transcriptional regulator